MKLIYFIDRLDTPGGMERVLTIKINYLCKKKYDISIIIKNKKGTGPFFKLDDSVKIYYLDVNNNKDFENKSKNIINKINPDYCISLVGDEVYFLHKFKDGSKKIAEFHNSKQSYIIQADEGKLKFFKKLYRYYLVNKLKNALSKYDKFVHLTYEDQGDWGNLSNSVVIPNPLTFPVEDKDPNYQAKNVISVGRISFQKGFDYLIRAWQIVNIQYPDWNLTILGRRKDVFDNLDEQIIKMNLENSIIVKDAVSNVKDYYLESSFYVASSRYEGFPMTLLEAASCGLPIVTWKCPTGPSEIINDNIDGYLSGYLNVTDLAANIIRMIENDDKEEFGIKAKDNIGKFSTEIVMNKWEELFNL